MAIEYNDTLVIVVQLKTRPVLALAHARPSLVVSVSTHTRQHNLRSTQTMMLKYLPGLRGSKSVVLAKT